MIFVARGSIEAGVSDSLVRHYIIYVALYLTGILSGILCRPRIQSVPVVSANLGPCLSVDVIFVDRGSVEGIVSTSLVRHYIIYVAFSLT